MKNRYRKMLHKAMARAEVGKRFATAEGWFIHRAWDGYSIYNTYVKEAITWGPMKSIMRKKEWRTKILYKVSHIRKLPN